MSALGGVSAVPSTRPEHVVHPEEVPGHLVKPGAEPILRATAIEKYFGTHHVLRGCSMTVFPGETIDDPRAIGQRQEHVPALPELPRGAERRASSTSPDIEVDAAPLRSRTRRERSSSASSGRGPAWCSRSSTCSRTSRSSATSSRPRSGSSTRSRHEAIEPRSPTSRKSASSKSATSTRHGSRAASGSVSRSPVRSRWSPTSCCSTSRRARSTRHSSARC